MAGSGSMRAWGGWATVIAALLVVASSSAAAEPPTFAGLSVPEALKILQEQRLVVIFSTALVRDDMVVSLEPKASDPRAKLDEILAEHGLDVMEGPNGQLVVVRAAQKTPPAPPPEPIRGAFDPTSVFLNEIVVTPSHFRIFEAEPESRFFLSREQVEHMPHAADDLYRAVKRLPGTAGGDVSAQFSVRGGETEELLVILDGVELYEPFHLKDFQSIFSTIDAEAVGGVDFLTGGFPVQYGDRMSGVMDISTSTPAGPAATTVALGTINARLVSEGSFNKGRGQWLVNARAWYPDAIVDLASDTANEVITDYYDLIAKLQHSIGSHSTLSGNLLFAYDDLGFTEQDEESQETVAARYRSHQEWLNLRTDWNEALFSQSVLSAGRIKRQRTGGAWDLEDGTLDVDDHREVDFFGFKQDWTWQAGDSHYLKWGVEARRESAVYDYSNLSVVFDTEEDEPPEVSGVDVNEQPSGTSYAAYVADRFRLAESFVVEFGLRWDKQFYVGDYQLSPRINLMYEAGPRTTIRAAWGRFYQSQRINELQVEDGVTEYYPAQLAEHTMVSLEHRFESDLAMRFEVYNKNLSNLRPRYENLFNPIELFPEAAPDRVRIAPDSGRSRGLEVLLRRASGRAVDWWVSYSLSKAEDTIDGEDVPRSWDQRHAASFGLNWSLPREWNLNLAGAYHSGWPTTEVLAEPVTDEEGDVDYELVLGPRNGERLPSYLRFDLRVSRSFATDHGDFRVYLEILNLTNRKNVCCLDDFEAVETDNGAVELFYKQTYWAPIIPSLAVSWTF